jgi:MFS family permease
MPKCGHVHKWTRIAIPKIRGTAATCRTPPCDPHLALIRTNATRLPFCDACVRRCDSLMRRDQESRGLPRSFRLLWAAAAASNIGDGLRFTALPLLATTVTTDPRAIAGVTIAERIPWLIFILPGGAWADRYDRRMLRVSLDIVRGMVMASLVYTIAVDRLTIVAVYIVTALLASAEAIVDSSSMALVPATVKPHDLVRAGSRLSSTEVLTNELIGPPLGGLLFGLAVVIPFGVDAASFFVAALIMMMLPGSFRPEAAQAARAPLRREIMEGFRWLWRHRALRNLALISMVLAAATFVGNSVFVLFATQTLKLSGFGFGLLLVPGAVGGLTGSMLATRFDRYPLRSVLFGSLMTTGVVTTITAAVSSPLLVSLLWGTASLTSMIWIVLTVALRQRVIPQHLLGRVGASYRFLMYAGMPLGALLGGLLAESFSVRTALAVSGLAFLVFGPVVFILLREVTSSGEAGV